jgi:hypothetical protein
MSGRAARADLPANAAPTVLHGRAGLAPAALPLRDRRRRRRSPGRSCWRRHCGTNQKEIAACRRAYAGGGAIRGRGGRPGRRALHSLLRLSIASMARQLGRRGRGNEAAAPSCGALSGSLYCLAFSSAVAVQEERERLPVEPRKRLKLGRIDAPLAGLAL